MKVEGVLNEITGNSLKARSKEDSSIGLLILYVRLAWMKFMNLDYCWRRISESVEGCRMGAE